MAEQNDLQRKSDTNPVKFRISPLNFATALFFILAGYIFIYGAKVYRHRVRPFERYHRLDLSTVWGSCVIPGYNFP
jgi:hypothetical protein